MDDLTAIRELLSEPPISPEAAAAGRDRLAAAFSDTPRQTPLRSVQMTDETTLGPVRKDRHAATRTARRTALGVGLLGAAAAVTLLITSGTLAGGPGTGPATVVASDRPVRALTAQQVLLAAATSAARTPAEGANWVRGAVSGNQRVEPGGRYTLELTSSTEMWVSPAPGKPIWFIRQDLGTKPATPRDEEAWRAAGSPTSWVYPGPGGKPDEVGSVTLQSGPGEPVATRDGTGKLSVALLGRPMSRATLSKLPTTPDGLRDYLKPVITKRYGAEAADVDMDAELYETGVRVIMDLPVPSEVRAAAYRMLASLPGVTADGEVTDPLGRTGQAVSLRHSTGEYRLIMDTVTGQPLASVSTIKGTGGEARSYTAIKRAGWTDDEPELPARRRGSEAPPA
ncbi:CU044_5270 family protein [Streptosporangium sp. NPDC003464]